MTSIVIRVQLWASGVLSSLREERGQDLLEYAMIGGLVAIAIFGAIAILTPGVQDLFTGIKNCIDFGPSPCTPTAF